MRPIVRRITDYLHVRAGMTAVATNAMNAVLAMTTGILLARALGPTGRGALAAGMACLAVVLQLADLSIMQTVAYFAARKGADARGAIRGTATEMLLLNAALVIPAAWLVVGSLPYASGTVTVIRIFLLAAPFSAWTGLLTGLVHGAARTVRWNILRVLPAAAWLVIAILVAAFIEPQEARVFAIGYVVSAVVTLAMAYPSIPKIAPKPRVDRRLRREMLRFTGGVHLSGLLVELMLRADILILTALSSTEEAGLYAVAVGVSRPTIIVGQAIAALILPEVARAELSGPASIGSRLFPAATATAATAALGSLVAPTLIPLLYGPAFAPSLAPARVLFVGQFFFAIGLMLTAVLKGLSRPWTATCIDAAAVVLFLILLLVWTPAHGMMGAARAFLASCVMLSMAAMLAIKAARRTGEATSA